MPVRTTNAALQQKLDELAAFAEAGDKKAFVEAFVPLDCSPEDTANYLSVLTEDDAEWAALAAEVQAIADGATVEKIEGNQRRGRSSSSRTRSSSGATARWSSCASRASGAPRANGSANDWWR